MRGVLNLDARRNLSGVCRSAAVTSSRHWLNWTRCSPAGVEKSPQRPAGFLLKRPVGRHQTKFDDTTPTSAIRAGSWNKLCRVVAKVEWHPGKLYPRVGFIVTNMSRPTKNVVAFYNKRGTCSNGLRRAKARSNGRDCHVVRSPPTRFVSSFMRRPTISVISYEHWRRPSRSGIGR